MGLFHEGHSWPAAPQEPFFFINGLGSRELHIMWREALYIHMCAGPWHLRCCFRVIGPKVFTVDPHQTITKCRSLYLSRVMTPSLIDSCTLSDTFLMCCFFMCCFSLKCLNYPPTFFNYTYFLKWLWKDKHYLKIYLFIFILLLLFYL